MAASNLQSNLVPLKVSSDDGTTYKTLTCLTSANFSGTTPTTEEQTQCGTFTGLGSNAWEWSVEAIVNLTPTGASEVSYEECLGFWHNQTEILVKQEYPVSAGTDFYKQGACYITSIGNTVQVGNSMTFSLTLKGNGALDIAP
jgi:hypothetical protein